MELVHWVIGVYLLIFQIAIYFMSGNFFYALKEKSYFLASVCVFMVTFSQLFTYLLLTQLLIISMGK